MELMRCGCCEEWYYEVDMEPMFLGGVIVWYCLSCAKSAWEEVEYLLDLN